MELNLNDVLTQVTAGLIVGGCGVLFGYLKRKRLTVLWRYIVEAMTEVAYLPTWLLLVLVFSMGGLGMATGAVINHGEPLSPGEIDLMSYGSGAVLFLVLLYWWRWMSQSQFESSQPAQSETSSVMNNTKAAQVSLALELTQLEPLQATILLCLGSAYITPPQELTARKLSESIKENIMRTEQALERLLAYGMISTRLSLAGEVSYRLGTLGRDWLIAHNYG